MENDPLFVGLTRPTLLLGVNMKFAMINVMLCMMLYVMFTNIKFVFLLVAIHIFGYILSFREPRFMELYIIKLGECNQCPTKGYYGANSYEVW